MLLIIFCKSNKPAIVDKLNKRDRNIILFGGNEKTKEKEKVGKMWGGVAGTFIWISKKKSHHVKIVGGFLCQCFMLQQVKIR